MPRTHRATTQRRRKHPPLPPQTKRSVFSSKDFTSNDGMLTTVWGPAMWHYLHTMSFNYPVHPTPANKRHYRDFVLNLQNVLPCGKCRENLTKNLKTHPLLDRHLASRDAFSRYLYELHEVVNDMLHKKSGLSYDQVRERYEHFRARCASSRPEQLPAAGASSSNGTRTKTKTRTTRKGGTRRLPKEQGCTEPLVGEKAKCVLDIVPLHSKRKTLTVDKRCIKRKPATATATATG